MKTPEEIKKGLEVCTTDEYCEGCPYAEGGNYLCKNLRLDALTYIQQIEDAIDKTKQLMQSATEVIKKSQEQLESTYSQVKKTLCGKENVSWVEVLEAADQLKSRLAQAERDAKEMADNLDCAACAWCEYFDSDYANEACKECRTYNEGFKLRGACPENTKEVEE